MPIDADRLDDRTHEPTSPRIVRFLATHTDQAFTRREIAAAVDADPETVGTNLTRLKDRGLVRHREPHWAFTDDHVHAATELRARYGDAFISDIGLDAPIPKPPGDANPPVDDTDHAPETDSLHAAAATAFLERARDDLGDAVTDLRVFGSVATGDQTPESDVDVLAVIADAADYAATDDRLLDIAYDVQLEYGVRIEVHSLTADEFEARRTRGDPFITHIVESGTVDA